MTRNHIFLKSMSWRWSTSVKSESFNNLHHNLTSGYLIKASKLSKIVKSDRHGTNFYSTVSLSVSSLHGKKNKQQENVIIPLTPVCYGLIITIFMASNIMLNTKQQWFIKELSIQTYLEWTEMTSLYLNLSPTATCLDIQSALKLFKIVFFFPNKGNVYFLLLNPLFHLH